MKPTRLNSVTNARSTKDRHNWVRSAVTIVVFVLVATILFLLCRFFPPRPP